MNTELIVMYNNFAMFILSFSTTYWVYRTYALPKLVYQLSCLNWTTVHGYDHTPSWHKAIIIVYKPPHVQCLKYDANHQIWQNSCNDSLQTIYLFSEHENLYSECNDLLSGERKLIAHNGFYSEKCNNFISNPLHNIRKEYAIRILEVTCFHIGCTCMVIMIISVITGTYASFRDTAMPQLVTGIISAALAALYAVTIVLYGIKLKIMQRQIETMANPPNMVIQEELIIEHSQYNVGYSMGAACISCVLTAVSSYMFVSRSRALQAQHRHIYRRRQMQVALLHQCRPDVALAVRKKVHITNQT